MDSFRVAIDVMSGDFGAAVLVAGVLEARRRVGEALEPYLCGDRDQILAILNNLGGWNSTVSEGLHIEHCPETVTQSDVPSRTWKNKQNSSIIRCISLQKEGRVDASLSAGHTGVLMSAAVFILGCLENVSRPALAAFLPTSGPRPSLLLDVGANVGCRTNHLVSFGMLGYSYYKWGFGIERPRLALLNIGKEPSKGTQTITETGKMLAKRCEGYIGFIEGSDVLSGQADVIVCDGFTGNVLLKACESFHGLIEAALSDHKKAIALIKSKIAVLNSENYGAVPLLGVKGMVMKAHGASSSAAIANALEMILSLAGQGNSGIPRTPQRKGSYSLVF